MPNISEEVRKEEEAEEALRKKCLEERNKKNGRSSHFGPYRDHPAVGIAPCAKWPGPG